MTPRCRCASLSGGAGDEAPLPSAASPGGETDPPARPQARPPARHGRSRLPGGGRVRSRFVLGGRSVDRLDRTEDRDLPPGLRSFAAGDRQGFGGAPAHPLTERRLRREPPSTAPGPDGLGDPTARRGGRRPFRIGRSAQGPPGPLPALPRGGADPGAFGGPSDSSFVRLRAQVIGDLGLQHLVQHMLKQ